MSRPATEPLLVAVPNLSDGRRPQVIEAAGSAIERAGARVLDIHSDATHDRTVLTAAGGADELVAAASELADTAARLIDLRRNEGVHPRRGALDVVPLVPVDARSTLQDAIAAAQRAAASIAALGVPVYLYGYATDPPRSLPEVRRLVDLGPETKGPDLGPSVVAPSLGVVCVGAREVLIAFNVWLEAGIEQARSIARRVRESDGGLPGVRALGLEMSPRVSQVSMNLTDPQTVGIDRAFEAVTGYAELSGAKVLRTEIVGLVPERFLPDPNMKAARLLQQPGRSLESVLATI